MARRVINSTGTPIAIAPSPKRTRVLRLEPRLQAVDPQTTVVGVVDGHRQLRALAVEAQVGFEPHAALLGGHAVGDEVGEHARAQASRTSTRTSSSSTGSFVASDCTRSRCNAAVAAP